MKVALIQQKYRHTKEETVEHTLAQIEKAVAQRADLIVLQELHQGPYFCQYEDPALFDLAEDFETDREFWQNVSKEYGIVIVASLFERRAPGLYHNSAFVFDKGRCAGFYRKMHIPDDPGFYEKFYFAPGDRGFEPIDTSIGRLGVLICWDQWFPEAARIMALKGAQILIYPTAIGWFDEDSQEEKERQLESWITIQRSHAIANALPVITVNRVGFEKDPSGGLNGIRFWGNSFVAGVQGEILCRGGLEEELLIAQIDPKRTENQRRIWPFLRDRRVDAYEDLLKRFCDD